MAHCLNPRPPGGHQNADGAISCQRCDFLVQGARVGGQYEVLSFLGAGSYGYVYKVREAVPLSRILALKVLRLDQFNEKAQKNFFQEARRIANMQHQHILPIYNFGQLDNEQPYFVMEYAPQTIYDLFTSADGKRRLAFAEELIPYLQQIADALSYVHNNGLIHQDIKPGNILIGRNGKVLLSDFGTTYYLGQKTHASLNEATGTAMYMPTEQWQGNPRRDSDQYALAVCCYELLAGRAPFVYQRLEEMWNAQANEQPPTPLRWNPRIPIEVAMVLLRALEKDYHRRYRSIHEFAEHYTNAVRIAQQRYVCFNCKHQNRTGAQLCAVCGTKQDQRYCPYCDAPVNRFGQRCCTVCGRLTVPPTMVQHSPLVGVSVRQERYIVKHVLKQSTGARVMTCVAYDTKERERQVVLKRLECAEGPMVNRAKDVAFYERVTGPLARLKHPFIPTVLDRFAEGSHYYIVMSYIDGESIEERLQNRLRPLDEQDVRVYLHQLLNALMALEMQKPPLRHYDISPSNVIIDRTKNRAVLTGFQIPVPPGRKGVTTLRFSPFVPSEALDQRTCIYSLAATMHYALTIVSPPHYPTFPAVRVFNPAISPALEKILARALMDDPNARYQSFEAMKKDVQRLL